VRHRGADPLSGAGARAGLTLIAVDYPAEFGLPDGREFAGLPTPLPHDARPV